MARMVKKKEAVENVILAATLSVLAAAVTKHVEERCAALAHSVYRGQVVLIQDKGKDALVVLEVLLEPKAHPDNRAPHCMVQVDVCGMVWYGMVSIW